MKEIFSSFKESLASRFSSPLIGAFTISWIFINWKIIVTLFFGNDSSYTIIETISKNYINFADVFLYPLLFSFCYIIIYPIISLGVSFVWEWTLPYKKRIQDYINNKIHVDIEELNEIRKMYEAVIYKQSEEIKGLESKVIAMTKELTSPHDDGIYSDDKVHFYVANEKDSDIDDDDKKIIIELGSYDQIHQDEFVSGSALPTVKVLYHLDRLYKNGFVVKNGKYLSLTEKGRAFVVENNLI